ncbi:MAG: ABC-F family ATP-binding cassette domain-containing protein [Bacteroidaceae bacterium]|nr:ABC-F family ATP-binding cassette domain-containing protein [Bacteroidaceae bacterium]
MDVQQLSKRIGNRVLFSDVTFTINEREHIGLIAKNGTGKSTLLSILAGEEGYDSGRIILRNDLRIGYLPQTPTFDGRLTALQAVTGNTEHLDKLDRLDKLDKLDRLDKLDKLDRLDKLERLDKLDRLERLERLDNLEKLESPDFYEEQELRASRLLTQLKITDTGQLVGTMSGGQVKRVALAKVLASQPNLLILDEPTNHLDLEMIEWLENTLGRTTMSIFMVTHDRYFLDRICSSIIEMDDSRIYTYRGNYSYYLQKRQERLDNLSTEIERANNLYRTELEWMRRMPQARGHKARYREEAFYELEKIARQRINERNVRLEMGSSYIGSKIFIATDVCKAFDTKVILRNFNYTFSRYEKLGIVGNNGTGKSTFIKTLLGTEPIDSGAYDIGQTVRFGYYSQEGLSFRDDQKVIDAVRDIAEYVDMGGGQRLSASQFLQHFLFTPEEQHTYIYKLSGGERRRLYLCTVLMRQPNFLILDEPTNDLDIVTLQILEQYLQDFRGCLIVVSHDRYFMDKVVDHILVFHGNGDIQDFPGNYTQYREWRSLQPKPQEDTPSPTPSNNNQNGRNANRQRRLTFKERREMEQLEADISRLEAEKRDIETALSSGTTAVERIVEMSKRLPLLNDELDEKSMRWLELSEIEG